MVTKLQFGFEVIASPKDEKSNVIVITSITTEDEKTYAIPEKVRTMNEHTELKKQKHITN